MPEEPSSRPEPQYWIKFLDPWVHDFYPVLGWGLGILIERAQFFPVPALDKNQSPTYFILTTIFPQHLTSPCRKRGEAIGDRQKSDPKRQKSEEKATKR